MEFMRAWQHTECLALLKVTHAHNTWCLITRMRFRIIFVAGQLVDFRSRQSTWLSFAQAFGQIQQCFIVFGFIGVVRGDVMLSELCYWEHGTSHGKIGIKFSINSLLNWNHYEKIRKPLTGNSTGCRNWLFPFGLAHCAVDACDFGASAPGDGGGGGANVHDVRLLVSKRSGMNSASYGACCLANGHRRPVQSYGVWWPIVFYGWDRWDDFQLKWK